MGRPRKVLDPNVSAASKSTTKRARVNAKGEVTRAVKSKLDVSTLPKLYKCECCGKIRLDDAKSIFFKTPQSVLHDGNDGYAAICVECCDRLYKEWTTTFKDQKFALLLVCSLIGAYFNERQYDALLQKSDDQSVPLGGYLRSINGTQFKQKTFLSYLTELHNRNEAFDDPGHLRSLVEGSWSAGDHRNKQYILQTLGYDCFDDETYTSEDRRFLYNTMSGYLSDDVLEDPHKIQAVINMCKTYLQLAQINMLINRQMKSIDPDMAVIKRMADTKTGLQHSINEIAKENAISAIGSGKKNKSTTALTAIMKEMLDNGIDEAKANVVSAKMVSTYQTIASVNAKGLVEELQFTGDEYAKMVAEQSVIIRDSDQKIMELEEENRLLKVKLERAYKAGYEPTGDMVIGGDDAC